MFAFVFVSVFILGLFIGSFLNTVVLRLEKDETVSGRSYCPKCQKKLGWYELIPLFSFIWQRGKCRGCKEKISIFYPLGEFATAVLFSLAAFSLYRNLDFAAASISSGSLFWPILFLISFLFYISVLFIVSLFDLRNYLVPEVVLITGFAAAVLFSLIFYFSGHFASFSFLGGYLKFFWPTNFFLSKILGFLVGGGFFFLIWLFSRGKAMGFGDVEVGAFIGFILGFYDGIFALIVAFFIGGITGLILMIFGRKRFKSHIPYAPFLSLGFLITMIGGKAILEFYFKLFGI